MTRIGQQKLHADLFAVFPAVLARERPKADLTPFLLDANRSAEITCRPICGFSCGLGARKAKGRLDPFWCV